jgi:hypothetical protein
MILMNEYYFECEKLKTYISFSHMDLPMVAWQGIDSCNRKAFFSSFSDKLCDTPNHNFIFAVYRELFAKSDMARN